MKKILTLIFVFVVSLSSFATTASADVIPMLPGDFYMEYSKELNYINRDYITDGASGSVAVYISPLDYSIEETLQNGEQINIDYTYEKDGELWGGNSKGWVLMDNLALIYDSTQFFSDHSDEFTEYTGEIFEIPTALLYSYPNSGTCFEHPEYPDYLLFTQSVSYVYTDENGNDWGLITYYRGFRNYWICLSNPTDGSLSSGYIEVGTSVSQQVGEDIIPIDYLQVTSQSQVGIFAIALVLAVAILATILIVKKRK
ncbi:MAG: hypothetical protein R3Y32_08225 [Bacillota bacterium]